MFVAEGRLVVERLIATGRYEIQSILVTESARTAVSTSLSALDPAIPIYVAAARDLEAITGFHLHRGCLALVRRPASMDCHTLVRAARTIVVLEAVSDADNVGSIFRNAWALGVDAIVLNPTSCDPLYRKAIRTSMAATLVVPFAQAGAWPDDLRALRASGFELIALSPQPPAITLGEFVDGLTADRRVALMFGAEGAGLSPQALDLADQRVRIPIAQDVDSLNVAVASGIVLARIGRTPVSGWRPPHDSAALET